MERFLSESTVPQPQKNNNDLTTLQHNCCKKKIKKWYDVKIKNKKINYNLINLTENKIIL